MGSRAIPGGRFPRGGAYAPLALFLLVAAGLAANRWAARTGTAAMPLRALRGSAIPMRPQPRPCLAVPEDDMAGILAQVQPDGREMSTSLYLHAFRVFDRGVRYRRGRLASSDETLRLFADDAFSKRVLGTPLMVRTPNGLRCTPEGGWGAQESHRDYCLAVLSERGVPASFRMVVGGKPFALKDFLADSVANFHPAQEEIEWTALAYAVWLPPGRAWTNKFGQTFSFDDLATELMGRPLGTAVCAGSHLVQAMIVMSRVDGEVCPILSPEVRGRLTGRLREVVREAEAAQAPDGSWGPDWHEKLPQGRGREPERKGWSDDSSALGKRLLATSHVAEWLLLMPEELRVRDDRFERAGRWLHARLKGADPLFVRDNFCACCHGAIVLQLVRDTAGETPVGRSRGVASVSAHAVHQKEGMR